MRPRGRAPSPNNKAPLLLCADDVSLAVMAELGQSVVVAVGEKRLTGRRWNLMAEAVRQTMAGDSPALVTAKQSLDSLSMLRSAAR